MFIASCLRSFCCSLSQTSATDAVMNQPSLRAALERDIILSTSSAAGVDSNYVRITDILRGSVVVNTVVLFPPGLTESRVQQFIAIVNDRPETIFFSENFREGGMFGAPVLQIDSVTWSNNATTRPDPPSPGIVPISGENPQGSPTGTGHSAGRPADVERSAPASEEKSEMNEDGGRGTVNIGLIVGPILGGVVLVVAGSIFGWLYCVKREESRQLKFEEMRLTSDIL